MSLRMVGFAGLGDPSLSNLRFKIFSQLDKNNLEIIEEENS